MFLYVSVILSTEGEYLGRYTPWQVHPPGQVPPGRYPPGQVHPAARYTPRQVHPQPQCMLGYGQQAGGTHPTGMHSCCVGVFIRHTDRHQHKFPLGSVLI